MDALIEKIELFLLSGGYFPKGFNLGAFLEEHQKMVRSKYDIT
jgi:hypothetical protein